MPSPSTVLLRTQTDERLVALFRAGHDRAFDAIVERYRRPLLRACRRILPEARAEDALQQALVAAWNGLRRGDDVRDLRPWLYRITRNTALNHLRVSGYDVDELMDSLTAADDPEEEVLRRAVVRQTLAAVAALPDRQREALLRTAVSGHEQEEVARDLGLSTSAMRQLVHRARVTVRTTATALVPMPFAMWLAAGAGGAGAIAKAGTVVVLAGGAAVAAPAIVEHRQAPARQHVERRAERPRPKPRATAEPTATVVVLKAVATPAVVRATATARPQREADDHVDRPAPESTRREADDHESRAAPTPEADHEGHGPGDDATLERDDGSADESPSGRDDSSRTTSLSPGGSSGADDSSGGDESPADSSGGDDSSGGSTGGGEHGD